MTSGLPSGPGAAPAPAASAIVPVRPAELVEALDAALREVGPGALVAFDADGTLWSGDIGFDVFGALLEEHGVRAQAADALGREASAAGIAVSGTPSDVAHALRDAWQSGRYAEPRAFAMMAWAFAGWRVAEVDAFAVRVFERTGLSARVHASLREVFAWVERTGVDTLVVSASPELVVRAALRHLALPLTHVVAMAPRIDGGVLQPDLAAPPVYGPGKVDAIERVRPGAALLAAFGDSGYDAAMLRVARVRVAVAPKPALLEAAKSLGTVFVLGAS